MVNSDENDIEFIAMAWERDKENAKTLAMTVPAVAEFVETWGSSCGASRDVFLGHLTHMLANIRAGYDLSDVFDD